MYGSVTYLKASHSTKAANSVMPAVRDERVSSSHSLSLNRPSTSTSQVCAMVSATTIRTATRMQRATTSGNFSALLAGVQPGSCESRRRTKAWRRVSKNTSATTRIIVSSMASGTFRRPEMAP